MLAGGVLGLPKVQLIRRYQQLVKTITVKFIYWKIIAFSSNVPTTLVKQNVHQYYIQYKYLDDQINNIYDPITKY